ncbi:MAG: HAMP domain-containing histidine kinase [Betaproteobacteria bacterium]|nr:HAMP domain-containing histidine kinase [Betaproteobacteria bacterium]
MQGSTDAIAGTHRITRWARPNLVLGLMLFVLHAGLMFGVGTGASRALLLAHFGLFLLWQPLWQGTSQLVARRAVLIVAGGASLAWWSTWWLVGLWIALLFSLIGGSLPGLRAQRRRLAPLLAALYLLSVLLVWVVPHLVGSFESQPLLVVTVRYLLAVPLLIIIALPSGRTTEGPRYAVDLFYSFLLFLLVIVLVLGALFVQQITQHPYALALAQTVIAIAGVMFLLSWLWDARGGFDGVGQLLSRYFLSLGMPFERWMYSLANLAEGEDDPDDFIAGAAQEMLSLPWVSGVDWKTAAGEGSIGTHTRSVTRFEFRGLDLRLHTRWSPGPGMLLHMRLLARLLGDYYDAKVREQDQRRTAYLQAIYETGSRVTHDVKNLLQSLRSLCAAAESGPDAESEALRRLIQRQLPQIAQRLQTTLDKLDTRRTVPIEMQSAAEWWRALTQRYAHEQIEFHYPVGALSATLPPELFDSVADNLVQNALEKRRRGEAARIQVVLEPIGDRRCRLQVNDDGQPMGTVLAARLFREPVVSETGLGVGLYQAARQAADQGYRLRLAHNRAGNVAFTLEPE